MPAAATTHNENNKVGANRGRRDNEGGGVKVKGTEG